MASWNRNPDAVLAPTRLMKPTDSYWSRYRASIARALDSMVVTDGDGKSMDVDDALEALVEWAQRLRDRDGGLHLVGNGASASMASHMAADWAKNAGVR